MYLVHVPAPFSHGSKRGIHKFNSHACRGGQGTHPHLFIFTQESANNYPTTGSEDVVATTIKGAKVLTLGAGH